MINGRQMKMYFAFPSAAFCRINYYLVLKFSFFTPVQYLPD